MRMIKKRKRSNVTNKQQDWNNEENKHSNSIMIISNLKNLEVNYTHQSKKSETILDRKTETVFSSTCMK